MATTSRVQITEGSGKNVTTYSISEDSVTKDLQRVALNKSDGTEGGVIQGMVPSASANSGNPVKMGGVYNTTPPTLTDGKIGDLQVDSSGNLKVAALSAATIGAEYHSTAPTYVDGATTVIQTDVNGNHKVTLATLLGGEDLTNNLIGVISKPVAASTYSPSAYIPMTQVTKANIKGSAGNVLSFYITNDNATVRYFQLHNKATAPAGTDVPLYSFKVAAGTANNPGVLEIGTEFFTTAGKYFSTGIGWAISTTFATFTDSATNTEHIVAVHYV